MQALLLGGLALVSLLSQLPAPAYAAPAPRPAPAPLTPGLKIGALLGAGLLLKGDSIFWWNEILFYMTAFY